MPSSICPVLALSKRSCCHTPGDQLAWGGNFLKLSRRQERGENKGDSWVSLPGDRCLPPWLCREVLMRAMLQVVIYSPSGGCRAGVSGEGNGRRRCGAGMGSGLWVSKEAGSHLGKAEDARVSLLSHMPMVPVIELDVTAAS